MKKTDKFRNPNLGFTLIEAIIAIGIIGIIGFILSDLLSRTFKGSDKTKLISKIVQNGQVALNHLDQAIRNSDAVICTGTIPPSAPSIVVYTKGQYTRFVIYAPTSANGYISRDTLTVISEPVDKDDFCNNQSTGDFTSVPTSLTDSGVSVVGGSFTTKASQQAQDANRSDAVAIEFKIGPSVSSGQGFQDKLDPVDFKTTVKLR